MGLLSSIITWLNGAGKLSTHEKKIAGCNWLYQQSIGYGAVLMCVLLSLKECELRKCGVRHPTEDIAHPESKFFSGNKQGIFGFLMTDDHHCYPSKWSVKPNICFCLPEQIFQEEYTKNEMSKKVL